MRILLVAVAFWATRVYSQDAIQMGSNHMAAYQYFTSNGEGFAVITDQKNKISFSASNQFGISQYSFIGLGTQFTFGQSAIAFSVSNQSFMAQNAWKFGTAISKTFRSSSFGFLIHAETGNNQKIKSSLGYSGSIRNHPLQIGIRFQFNKYHNQYPAMHINYRHNLIDSLQWISELSLDPQGLDLVTGFKLLHSRYEILCSYHFQNNSMALVYSKNTKFIQLSFALKYHIILGWSPACMLTHEI